MGTTNRDRLCAQRLTQEAPILLDPLLHACLGFAFALAARDRLRADGPFVTPAFLLVVMFTGLIVLPLTLYLYGAHAAWSWLYLLDPAAVPALAVVPIAAAHAGAVIAAWYLGARFLQAGNLKFLAYATAGTGVAFLLGIAIFQRRLRRDGSFADWQADNTLGLMQVELGYALIALALGMAGAAAYVMIELSRDARRVRAR